MYHSVKKSKNQQTASDKTIQKKSEKSIFQLADNRHNTLTQKNTGFHFKDNRSSNSYRNSSIPKTNSIFQLTKTDSAIPLEVSNYFSSKGTTYHSFKQNHWDEIAKAHTEAHGSEPTTQGAAYTIDAKTGKKLIENLGPDWKAHDDQHREDAIKNSKKKSQASRKLIKKEREEQAVLPRAYKSHEDAKQKLAKQPHLGTKYRLKKDKTLREYDINDEN